MTGWTTWARRVGRAAVVPLVCVAGMTLAVPAGATATPPSADAGFIGTWVNTDTVAPDLGQVVITSDGAGGLLVDAFGACTPNPCEIGQVEATMAAPAGSTDPGRTFLVDQDLGYEHIVLIGKLSGTHHSPRLRVDWYHDFTDGSGRSNFVTTNRMVPAAAAAATTTGTVATDLPTGDSPRPANDLVGDWHNTSAHPSGILEEIITRAPDGSLNVHQIGACTPDPCDNGTVTAVSFGRSAASTGAKKLLVPYDFGFEREIDAVSISGHTLKVVEHVEFTDGSLRPNIVNTDTFTR